MWIGSHRLPIICCCHWYHPITRKFQNGHLWGMSFHYHQVSNTCCCYYYCYYYCETAVMFLTILTYTSIHIWIGFLWKTHTHTTVLQTFFQDHSGEPVPEENFGSMVQGKINRGRHTDYLAGRHSIRTNQCQPPPSPIFFTGRMPFLPSSQQRRSTFYERHCTLLLLVSDEMKVAV